jgi:protein-disulfide isomerase
MRLIASLLITAALFGQASAPKPARPAAPAAPAAKSAFNKATLEAYVRHLYLYLPNIQLTISDPIDTGVPGFKQVKVRASLNEAFEDREFLVSNDGRKVLVAQVYDIADNPFKAELDKLKPDLAPSIGTPGAPVIIVLFSDFQCGYCREEAKMIRENLLQAFPTQVRVYFKDYPLTSIHDWAKPAALAGRCVFQQQPLKFWDYHDWVFEEQPKLNAAEFGGKFAAWAKDKGLDPEQLTACQSSKATEAQIERTLAEGKELGVNSTPTMFINGRRINFSIKWPNLKQVIEFEIGYQSTAKNAGEHCCELTLPNLLGGPK